MDLDSALAMAALLVATALTSTVALVVLRRGDAPGARALAAYLLAGSVWTATYAAHWSQLPRPAPLFWLDATYLGVVAVPPAFFAFALRFSGVRSLPGWRLAAGLAAVPLITLLLLWTDPAHGLFFGGERPSGGAIFSGGPWFWVNVVYSYGLILAALVLLGRHALGSARIYRRQTAALLVGIGAPLLINGLSLAGYSPLPGIDLTPFAFSISSLACAQALLSGGLFTIVPIAHDLLIAQMRDGVLVLDRSGRIVDLNPAARTLLALGADAVGAPATVALAALPALAVSCADLRDGEADLALPGPPPRQLSVQRITLADRIGRPRGRLLVLSDISARVAAADELRRLNSELAQRVAENDQLTADLREQALRDVLTGLYNRRYLEQRLSREIGRARHGAPLGLLLIDIDHFKLLNDQYGHRAGDRMLQSLATVIQSSIRVSDVACRYGGEEFVILMPGSPPATVLARAEQIRAAFADLVVPWDGGLLRATISLGVAIAPLHATIGERLIQAADEALYAAKAGGRDRVVSA